MKQYLELLKVSSVLNYSEIERKLHYLINAENFELQKENEKAFQTDILSREINKKT